VLHALSKSKEDINTSAATYEISRTLSVSFSRDIRVNSHRCPASS